MKTELKQNTRDQHVHKVTTRFKVQNIMDQVQVLKTKQTSSLYLKLETKISTDHIEF